MKTLLTRAAVPFGLLAFTLAASAQIPVKVTSLVIDNRNAGDAAHPGDWATLSINTADGAVCTPGVGRRSGGNNVKGLSSVSKKAVGGSASWRWQIPADEKVPVTWSITVSCLKGSAGRDTTSLTVVGP